VGTRLIEAVNAADDARQARSPQRLRFSFGVTRARRESIAQAWDVFIRIRAWRRVDRYGRVNLIVEVAAVYVRVVRFSDVSAERIEGLRARIEESDGPPPGVPTTGLKVLYDGEQGTAVVLQYFATAEDMEAGAQAFSAMDPADTPGTRASVDMCEIKLEVEAS
jgi:hypothetical protein